MKYIHSRKMLFVLWQSIAESLQTQTSPRSLVRSESVSSVSSQDTVRSHTGSK